MALYKYPKYLIQSDDPKFDAIYQPGSITSHSGLYRCEGCGHEIVSESGKPLPPQNHHQHAPIQGAIRWRLIVW
jgi:hypothetical protein